MTDFTPTKTNLDRAKHFLVFAHSSHALLDRKRKVLIQEMMERVSRAQDMARELQARLDEVYQLIIHANIVYGSLAVEELARTVDPLETIEQLSSSVMGVSLPRLLVEDYQLEASYGMYRGGVSLDHAMEKMVGLRRLLFQFAEMETAISRLAYEIDRTAKRVNSIEKIQIPRYEALVKTIEEALEEKDREDLFRLKIVKKKLK
ncbi:MAG TPA: V-type ATP synthase subunit D [Tissierellia bacterium]|nr:V-type ATP synthase subunit D [Tissierellia bacterium]